MNAVRSLLKRSSTLFLRAAVSVLGLLALTLCSLLVVIAFQEDLGHYRPILILLFVSAIPFLIALHQTLKLLSYIETSKVFSDAATNPLGNIKYCAVVISGLYAASMPYIYIVAEKDDAPGLILIGLVIVFASMVVAVFAAVLHKLLEKAIEIKSENDLTV